jgi:hypothetical protein
LAVVAVSGARGGAGVSSSPPHAPSTATAAHSSQQPGERVLEVNGIRCLLDIRVIGRRALEPVNGAPKAGGFTRCTILWILKSMFQADDLSARAPSRATSRVRPFIRPSDVA